MNPKESNRLVVDVPRIRMSFSITTEQQADVINARQNLISREEGRELWHEMVRSTVNLKSREMKTKKGIK